MNPQRNLQDLIAALDESRSENANLTQKLESELRLNGYFAGGAYHSDHLEGAPTREQCAVTLRTLRALTRHRKELDALMRNLNAHIAEDTSS